MGVAEVVRRRVNTDSHIAAVRALCIINTLLMGSVVAFGLASSFGVALAAYWSTYVLRRTDTPILTAWINQSLDRRVRATVLSMHGQVDAIGQIAGGAALRPDRDGSIHPDGDGRRRPRPHPCALALPPCNATSALGAGAGIRRID